jgi:hypothetical protein
VTLTLDTTGADFAVIGIVHNGVVQTFSVADNKGNTGNWNKRPDYVGNPHCETWDLEGGTFGTNHQITVSLATGSDPIYMTLLGASFSGSSASPYDTGNGNGNVVGGNTSCNPGAITPDVAGELLIAVVGLPIGATGVAIDSGFTILDGNDGGVSGQYFGGTMAYLIDSGAGLITPTWTWTGGTSYTNLIAAFKTGTSTQTIFKRFGQRIRGGSTGLPVQH